MPCAIGTAQALGLAVVATGVDAPQQLQLLGALGCDQCQGAACAPAWSATRAAAPADQPLRPLQSM